MKAVLIGAGAQGRVVLDLLRGNSEFNEIEFLDDQQSKWNSSLNSTLIAGGIDRLHEYDKNNFKALITLGNPLLRKQIFERLKSSRIPWMNLRHDSAYVASSVRFGAGNTVCAQAVVNSDVLIENHVLINNASIVEHDSVIGDYATVCPGAKLGGRVQLGEGSFICTGAIILPRVRVGSYSILAAGSVLTRDLPANVLALGSPARVVREIDNDFNWQCLL